jgi:C4-dicarboxylate transporter, DctM subunit
VSGATVGALSILAICVLIYGGVHIAVALALCSFIGVWMIKGNIDVAFNILGSSALSGVDSYDFAVIPLFVVAGTLIGSSGLAKDCFTAANQLLRRLRGGVGVATILGNAVLSAVTGVTIASVAIFTKLAVPEMLRLGYERKFAVGLVAGSGVLGMLIPPSLLMIVYCFLTEASIGKLFISAVIPGILVTVMLSLAVFWMAYRMPSFVGNVKLPEGEELMSGMDLLQAIAPIAALVLLIFGGLYGGVFTATEAGATSALAALIIAALKRRVNPAQLLDVMKTSGMITSAILILIIAAGMYSRMLAMSGLPGVVTEWLGQANLNFWIMTLAYLVLLLVLGTFLDSMSTILLSVPLLFPVFLEAGANVYWFGIITILATELGIVTPPLGISAAVVKSTLNDPSVSLEEIYAGSYPFLGIMVIALIILVAFPSLSTVLL